MKKNTKQIGDIGEDLAERELRKEKYHILERNFRTRYGEIDIIAKDKNILVFIEVKAKSGDYFGRPAEMVNKKKLGKIKRTAEYYLQENDYRGPCRIDVVEIIDNNINIIKNVQTI